MVSILSHAFTLGGITDVVLLLGIIAGFIWIAINWKDDSKPRAMFAAECGHFCKVRGVFLR